MTYDDDYLHPRSGKTGRFIFVQRPEQNIELDQAMSGCDSCRYASDEEVAHADHLRILRMLRFESTDRLEPDVEVKIEIGAPARLTVAGHTTPLESMAGVGQLDLGLFAEGIWDDVDQHRHDYETHSRPRTYEGEQRLTAIDPENCGCTECLIGEYLPWDRADRKDIQRLLRGELSNHNGALDVTLTSTGVRLGKWLFSYRELAGAPFNEVAAQITDR